MIEAGNHDELRLLQRQAEQILAHVSKMSGSRKAPTFGEFAKGCLETKLANPTLRPATKRSFKHQTTMHLIPAFGAMEMGKITNKEFMRWVVETREKKVEGTRRLNKFFNARKYLAEILIAAREEGHIERTPRLDNPDSPSKVGRVLADQEILKLLWRCRRPFRLVFYAFWKTGCRPREILQWEWSMFRWNEPAKTWIDIPARISKTDRARSIPLNPELSRTLARVKRVSPFVFPHHEDMSRPRTSYHASWTTARRRAGVAASMPYDFRRTFITTRVAKGQPPLYVAKSLDTSVHQIEKVYAKAQAEVMEEICR